MTIFTIGFTKRSAAQFFGTLQRARVRRIIDVRLHNISQLAGFAKRDDLGYFANALCGIEYAHHLELAPTDELLTAFRRERDWAEYEQYFLELLRTRRVEDGFSRGYLADACLLCSEATATHCHRRLVAEYFAARWAEVEISHL
jgi:uncharacterized protein (DUF488 family)